MLSIDMTKELDGMAVLRRKLSPITLIAVLVVTMTAAQAADHCDQKCAELILSLICEMDGEDPADGSLIFVLWDEQFNILQRVVNLRGKGSFAPLEFFAPGRYVCYITQEGGESLTVTYDTAAYQIVVDVWEESGSLTVRVAEVNRVTGDSVGEPRVLERLGADQLPTFKNSTRQVSMPPIAAVPQTSGGAELWLVTALISGLGLLLLVAGRKNACCRG